MGERESGVKRNVNPIKATREESNQPNQREPYLQNTFLMLEHFQERLQKHMVYLTDWSLIYSFHAWNVVYYNPPFTFNLPITIMIDISINVVKFFIPKALTSIILNSHNILLLYILLMFYLRFDLLILGILLVSLFALLFFWWYFIS